MKKKDPLCRSKEFFELSDYKVTIESYVFYENRFSYFKLFEKYLTNYRLSLGYKDSGKTDTLFGNIRYTSRRSGARVYWREVNGTIEILAKCDKGSKLQKAVIKILKKTYK